MSILASLKAFLTFAPLIAALRPFIDGLIDQAEELLPESGRGAEKLAWVKAGIAKVFDGITGFAGRFDEAWPAIQALIAGYVAFRNAAGIFKKGSQS